MDLQNCLNFQRELLNLPPSYPEANVTQWYRNASNTKKCMQEKKKINPKKKIIIKNVK